MLQKRLWQQRERSSHSSAAVAEEAVFSKAVEEEVRLEHSKSRGAICFEHSKC